jgi:hypothetical protein
MVNGSYCYVEELTASFRIRLFDPEGRDRKFS